MDAPTFNRCYPRWEVSPRIEDILTPEQAERAAFTFMLDYSEREAVRAARLLFGPEQKGQMVARVSAAALVRLPRLLRGIEVLARERLFLEAHGSIRTIVELAITCLWVGRDEERAEWVRDSGLASDKKIVERARLAGKEPEPELVRTVEERLKHSTGKGKLPPLDQRAQQVQDPLAERSGIRPSVIARTLYAGFYGGLSASPHGELGAAYTLLNTGGFSPVMMQVVLHATYSLLLTVNTAIGLSDPHATFSRITRLMKITGSAAAKGTTRSQQT